MKTNIRLCLDMGGRAVVFCTAHPDDNPASAVVVTRLTELMAQSVTMSEQQRSSLVAFSAAVDHKARILDSLRDNLAVLAGISRAASATNPTLTVHRRLPKSKVSASSFFTIARVAVAEAGANKDAFLAAGMPPGLLEAMTAQLDEYDAEMHRQRLAEAARVGAGAELASLTTEVMALVRHLDAIHRHRFRNDPELKAAWKSARNVAWKNPEPPTAAPPADTPKVA